MRFRDPTAADAAPGMDLDSALEHGKRAFALEKYEQAVEHYATALELMTKKYGDNAPEIADVYFAYGKALLENAISQSSVLGKEQPEDTAEEEPPGLSESTSTSGPILSFSGDAEDEDTTVDLLNVADEEDAAGADAGEEGEDGEDAEPEDDFNAAWEVLDLARAIYTKQTDDGADADVQLKLAETYITLGDVSLETEKFDQAITDYEAGLALKENLLPRSSRQIAEAHYKLSIVLDLTSGRLGDAITHAEHALESIECRLALLSNPLAGANDPAHVPDPKGKGKSRLVSDASVANMSATQIQAEIKELEGLKGDLAIKVEELKIRPDEPRKNASDLVAQALDVELNTNRPANGGAGSGAPQAVNDLTAMVVKKKKKPVAEASASGSSAAPASPPKRKADDEGQSSEGKKVRLDEP
ncbi:hypothetical protein GGX14DRAFT_363408 [Mycena pura]|uniref:Tetratricopeptide SHNi-TPR domain-containing protein n=1 Tax=Mycena pura TaxID=153505 RepID=A0AAD6VEA2_9AGAR|nr:hypothetical protein GGX14DRAFT_363408 [Mycena pura]